MCLSLFRFHLRIHPRVPALPHFSAEPGLLPRLQTHMIPVFIVTMNLKISPGGKLLSLWVIRVQKRYSKNMPYFEMVWLFITECTTIFGSRAGNGISSVISVIWTKHGHVIKSVFDSSVGGGGDWKETESVEEWHKWNSESTDPVSIKSMTST